MPGRKLPSDDVPVPRSPSGRIPQWVMDEAMGKTVTPVPFRGPVTPLVPPRAGARRRFVRGAGVLLVVAALTAVAFYFREPGLGAGASLGTIQAGPPAGNEESSSPLGAPPDVPPLPEGAAYRFMTHQDDGTTAVTWSPCRPIHYVVRPTNQPPGGGQLLAGAIAAVSEATGLQFVSDGVTDEGPSEDRRPYQPDRYGDRWAPVLIAWATPDEVPDFGVDIAGEAGPIRVAGPSGQSAYVSGVVYLDPAKLNGGGAAARAIVLHELGHLVGLAHVNDPAALMFVRNVGQTGYGPGDSAGLAALGQGPCQPDI